MATLRIAFERMAEGSPHCGHRHRVKLFVLEHREVSVGAEGLVGHPGEGEWRRHALSSLCRHCCSGWLLPGFRQLSVADANSSLYRQLCRAAAASIATSRALGGRGEVEWRARACNLSAPGSVAPEGFATSSLLGITLDSDAVCGRLKICVDRWYSHLHVFTLLLLALPLDHSLPILRPA